MLNSIARMVEYDRKNTLDLARTIPSEVGDRPVAGLPHTPAWIICHLGLADTRQHGTLTTGKPGGDDDGYWQQFGPDSDIARARQHMTARFGSWPAAIEAVAAIHTQLTAALRALDPARLALPHPNERVRAFFPTLADNVAYIPWHEGHHGAQLRAWVNAARHEGAL